MRAVDCTIKNASAAYDADVVISRNTSEAAFEIDIRVIEEDSIKFEVPENQREPG